MNALLIYPILPESFYSFDKAVKFMGKKAFYPPLSLITVAALLPPEWTIKIVDMNVRKVLRNEWDWAEIVLISGMNIQKKHILSLIQTAKKRKKLVAVGGPYANLNQQECLDAGTDFLVLGEGEITVPKLIQAIEQGKTFGIITSDGQHPDLTESPIPQFDLLNIFDYMNISVQFSRGCPFQCEFCDINLLNGRKIRTKPTKQFIAELQFLYDLGWRGPVFVVDDNFVAKRGSVKLLLEELKEWMISHKYPFSLSTQASIDMAQDQELIDLMVSCNFGAVFVGIETPDKESLGMAGKHQNTRQSLEEAVNHIQSSGIRVIGSFIIGFDNEKPGADKRIVDFVQKTSISSVQISMLQALPQTALWNRLQIEGRIKNNIANIHQSTLPNFIPTRSILEIASEIMNAFSEIYDPLNHLERLYQLYLIFGNVNFPEKERPKNKIKIGLYQIKAIFKLLLNIGFIRNTRKKFWFYLISIAYQNPKGLLSFIRKSAFIDYSFEYSQVVKNEIHNELNQINKTT